MWLFVPSASAPALEPSTLPSTGHFQNLAQSCTWKGKSIPSRSWQRVCGTASWMKPLFGAISQPSTAQHGVDQWIASLAESPASPSPSPASGPDSTTSDGSGTTCYGSFGMLASDSSHWRTCPDLFGMDSPLSSETWPTSGLMRRGVLYPLPAWAPRTSESACSYWPTALAQDAKHATHSPGQPAREGLNLVSAAVIWQTPGTDSFRSRGGDRKGEPGLDQQARMWPTPDANVRTGFNTAPGPAGPRPLLTELARNWPTPTTNDSKNDAPPSQYDRNTPPLNVEAVKWATPRASDHQSPGEHGNGGVDLRTQASRLHPTITPDGEPSSVSDPPSRPRLNPRFVAWLMNLPPGWTSCAPLETPSSSGRQPKRLPVCESTLESEAVPA